MTVAGIDLQNPVAAGIERRPIAPDISIDDAGVLRRPDHVQEGLLTGMLVEQGARAVFRDPIEHDEEGHGLEVPDPAPGQDVLDEADGIGLLVRHGTDDAQADLVHGRSTHR